MLFFLTAWLQAVAGSYSPLVFPVLDFPVDSARVYWADPTLAGTSTGVVELRDGVWTKIFPDREILVVGRHQDGWWAAGDGFCGLSNGEVYAVDDQFYGGSATADGLFFAGSKGVWKKGVKRLELVYPHSSTVRLRLFSLKDHQYLFAGQKVFVWDGKTFAAEPSWAQFVSQDVSIVRPFGAGVHLLTTEGLFYREGEHISARFGTSFKSAYRRATVDFQVNETFGVLATYYDGLKAASLDDQPLWSIGVKALGGNPYSVQSIPQGFRLGTSAGAVDVYSEVLSHVALSGEDVFSISDNFIFLPSGAVSLRTGELEKSDAFVEGAGMKATWGTVTLPSGKKVILGGRDFLAVGALGSHFFALQEFSLFELDAEGTIVGKQKVLGGNSALSDGQVLWVGTSHGLFLYEKAALTPVHTGSAFVVARGAEGPVFFSGDRIYAPHSATRNLPGKVLAVDQEFAVVSIEDRVFVGRYVEGWAPLDIPELPRSVSRIRKDGAFLYVVSRDEVLRVTIANAGVLSLPPSGERQVRLESRDYTGTFAKRRPSPWVNPEYEVQVDGVAIPVGQEGFQVQRVPYGLTQVEVVTNLAGLKEVSKLTIERSRPWWLSWPGVLLGSVSFVTAVWGLIRWRTNRLIRRAAELKRLVDQKTQALNEALQAREFFFSSVSHEIRNPLNGVVGLCGMLNESMVGSRERMIVRTLKGCSDQLRLILDDVLDFARIDRGEVEFYPEPFELEPAMEGASRSVDPAMERVQLYVPENLWLEGDVGKIRQIVTNLVSNALKYGQPSMARVDVKTSRREDGHCSLAVIVANSGPDLPVEEQKRIFDGFHRGEDAKRRRLPGSGLGLALSRRFARAMGGDITVVSQNGLTTFTLDLSLRPSAAPEAEAALGVPGKVSKALAIEDEVYNRMFLGNVLGQLGYEVDWAVDGASALECLRTGTYDVILTDYMLPDMDGVSLVKQMVQELPEPRPPIVMVTAYSTREKQEAAFAAGVSGFVTKPISPKKLRSALLGLGYHQRGRRSLDIFRPEGRFDFAVFKRMPDGRTVLGRFGEDADAGFQELVQLADKPVLLKKAAHALRGRFLMVHATTLAEQLACLEAAAASEDRDQVARTLSVIEPMVHDLSETARAVALSGTDFAKPFGDGVSHKLSGCG